MFVGPRMTPGKVYGCSELLKVVAFYFCEIARKNILKSANFFLLFILNKEMMLSDSATIKN